MVEKVKPRNILFLYLKYEENGKDFTIPYYLPEEFHPIES